MDGYHLTCAEQDPSRAPQATIIFMHGLGAPWDFVDFSPTLALPPVVRYVFPQARTRPVTINGGYAMPAWYDILGLDRSAREDEEGIRESAAGITALIRREQARGVPAERIVLAGFSQGGALALHTALRYPERLAGVAVLSGYLLLGGTLAAEAAGANRDLPIFQAHGRHDDVVPLAFARRGADHVLGLGYRLQWQEYAVAHGLAEDEVADLRAWLVARLGLAPAGSAAP